MKQHIVRISLGILVLLVFAIGVMDGLRVQFLEQPGHVLAIVAAASTIAAHFQPRETPT